MIFHGRVFINVEESCVGQWCLMLIMRDIMSAKQGQIRIYVWKSSQDVQYFEETHQKMSDIWHPFSACEEISEGKNKLKKHNHGSLMGSVWQEHWERILLFNYENKCKTQNPPQHIVALITGHLALWCFTDTVFFNKLNICGTPTSSNSIGAIF